MRDPDHRQLHSSVSEARGGGTPTTGSFIAQSVRLVGEGPYHRQLHSSVSEAHG